MPVARKDKASVTRHEQEHDTESPSWYLNELAYAGQEHLDSQYVAGYDHKARTTWAGDLGLLRGLGMDGTTTVVDLGAGTGTFALAAAPFCGRVVAVDV